MQKNYDRTSTLTESWHLQYYKELVEPPIDQAKQKNKKHSYTLRPVYVVVDAKDLKENIFVMEENPGIHELIEYNTTSAGHVVFITDRETHWPGLFM